MVWAVPQESDSDPGLSADWMILFVGFVLSHVSKSRHGVPKIAGEQAVID
jgi:hypothetical protein